MKKLMKHLGLIAPLLVLASSCAHAPATLDVPPPHAAAQPSGLPQTGSDEVGGYEAPGAKSAPPSGVTRLTPPPRSAASLQQLDWSGRFPSNDSVTVSVEALPLRDFINYSFNQVLKASYVMADGLPGLDDPVTLSLQKPVSSRAYYRLMMELLKSHKIGATFRDGVFFIHPEDGKAAGTIPIGFGRRPQDVPDVPGTVMQIIPLRFGLNVSIERTILDLVTVGVKSDPQQSAIFVTGERDAVLRALDVVSLLDQPASRAREVGIVSLSYIGSKEVAEQLVTLLGNEGILAGVGRADGLNVALVPLEELGALVVFAASPDLLGRVDYWVKQLDKPSQGPEERYFVYHPEHARASDLGESLAPLIGGTPLPVAGNLSRDTRSAFGAQSTTGVSPNAQQTGQYVTQENVLRRDMPATTDAQKVTSVKGVDVTLSVDPRSNSLIFYTSGQRYQALLPMIRRLDVPPKQVLMEATIAEVTLTGEFAYGVEFAFNQGNFFANTTGNLGLPDGGLSLAYLGSITNQIRLKLSQTDGLVHVLSNPTLVVRDGVEATIAVGNDVPTVGATATDPLTSETQITQVLYRKTGLELRLRPTINAQGLVVMQIEQRISNTQPGSSNVQGAPVFFERSVSTEVVARSGESILLAGLIADRETNDSSKVPFFGDVPGLGWLFRSDSKSKEKTELILIITPRVISDPSEWSKIRVGMQNAFEHLRLPAEPPAAVGVAAGDGKGAALFCSDSDADGVCDGLDRCPLSLLGATVDVAGCEVGETVLKGVDFEGSSAILSPQGRLALNLVARSLASRPDIRAEILGYAYRPGTSEGDFALSRARADAVRQYLISEGIDDARLTALGAAGPSASTSAMPSRNTIADRVTISLSRTTH